MVLRTEILEKPFNQISDQYCLPPNSVAHFQSWRHTGSVSNRSRLGDPKVSQNRGEDLSWHGAPSRGSRSQISAFLIGNLILGSMVRRRKIEICPSPTLSVRRRYGSRRQFWLRWNIFNNKRSPQIDRRNFKPRFGNWNRLFGNGTVLTFRLLACQSKNNEPIYPGVATMDGW